jgi:hypothetical protein
MHIASWTTPDISYAISALSLYFQKPAGCTRLWPVLLSTTSRQLDIMFLFWARGKEADENYIVASRIRQERSHLLHERLFRPWPGHSKISNGSYIFSKTPHSSKILKEKPDCQENDRGWVLCFDLGNHGNRVYRGQWYLDSTRDCQRKSLSLSYLPW